MVHTFTALGQYLAADVNSGAVHVLDKLSFDLLSLIEGPMGERLPQKLAEQLDQYDPQELSEAWEELRGLQDQGLLFSDDEYIDPEAAMALPSRQWSRRFVSMYLMTVTCGANIVLPRQATSALAIG